MCDLNNVLCAVIKDAINIGFPVPDCLDRSVYVDKNEYSRVGACYRYRIPDKYEIHISEQTLLARDSEIKNIIAHEVLHANFLTFEHNMFWTMYCDLMHKKFGYNIQVKYAWHKILK